MRWFVPFTWSAKSAVIVDRLGKMNVELILGGFKKSFQSELTLRFKRMLRARGIAFSCLGTQRTAEVW